MNQYYAIRDKKTGEFLKANRQFSTTPECYENKHAAEYILHDWLFICTGWTSKSRIPNIFEIVKVTVSVIEPEKEDEAKYLKRADKSAPAIFKAVDKAVKNFPSATEAVEQGVDEIVEECGGER